MARVAGAVELVVVTVGEVQVTTVGAKVAVAADDPPRSLWARRPRRPITNTTTTAIQDSAVAQ